MLNSALAFAENNYKMNSSTEEMIERLEDSVAQIKSAIETAEQRQISGRPDLLKLMEKYRAAAQLGDDFLAHFRRSSGRGEMEGTGNKSIFGNITACLPPSEEVVMLCKIVERLERLAKFIGEFLDMVKTGSVDSVAPIDASVQHNDHRPLDKGKNALRLAEAEIFNFRYFMASLTGIRSAMWWMERMEMMRSLEMMERMEVRREKVMIAAMKKVTQQEEMISPEEMIHPVKLIWPTEMISPEKMIAPMWVIQPKVMTSSRMWPDVSNMQEAATLCPDWEERRASDFGESTSKDAGPFLANKRKKLRRGRSLTAAELARAYLRPRRARSQQKA